MIACQANKSYISKPVRLVSDSCLKTVLEHELSYFMYDPSQRNYLNYHYDLLLSLIHWH